MSPNKVENWMYYRRIGNSPSILIPKVSTYPTYPKVVQYWHLAYTLKACCQQKNPLAFEKMVTPLMPKMISQFS